MKLKEFNAENCARLIPAGVASVSVNRKVGLISFSKMAATEMGLQEGDKLSVVFDEETGKDWYFKRSDVGFCVRQGKGKGGVFEFNNTRIAAAMLDSAKHTHETIATATFPIKTKPIEVEGEAYWLVFVVKPIREKAV